MGNLKARDHLEKLEVHERIAVTRISKKYQGSGWNTLDQDKDKWQAVMKVQVP
jgi:hypothetical protein